MCFRHLYEREDYWWKSLSWWIFNIESECLPFEGFIKSVGASGCDCQREVEAGFPKFSTSLRSLLSSTVLAAVLQEGLAWGGTEMSFSSEAKHWTSGALHLWAGHTWEQCSHPSQRASERCRHAASAGSQRAPLQSVSFWRPEIGADVGQGHQLFPGW